MDELVVVTGATGNVGREVVGRLIEQGRPVRTATPDPDRARDLFGVGVEHAAFDFEKPGTFAPAFAGAGAVFLMRPPQVSAVRRVMGPALKHLEASKGCHVVTLSVMGAGRNPLLPHTWMERLVERSGLPYTHLRPSFFMQNLSTTYRADIRDRGEIFVPAGRGRTSFVDVRDVAAVAARVLSDPTHHCRAYTLTGGEALDYFEVAETFTRRLSRPVRYAHPSVGEFRRRMRQQGVAPDFARVLSRIYLVARLGLAARVTPDTARLLNAPPTTLDQFVQDHAGVWA